MQRSRQNTQHSHGTSGARPFNEEAMMVRAWKENAMAFLKEMNEDEMPVPVQLKQIVERPSSGEMKMRAIKEQDLIKEKNRQRENKAKQESIEKEKKLLKANKGNITYDYDGKTLEVKPVQALKNTVLTSNIPYNSIIQFSIRKHLRKRCSKVRDFAKS
jgi:hypothetical protein